MEVINPLVALIAGILILLMPRLLNYVVAIYLIAIGILGQSRERFVTGSLDETGNETLPATMGH